MQKDIGMLQYKIYTRPKLPIMYPVFYTTEFIRECEKHKSLFYTTKWWYKQRDGIYKRRRTKKYVNGAKFIKDISKQEFEEMVFIDFL